MENEIETAQQAAQGNADYWGVRYRVFRDDCGIIKWEQYPHPLPWSKPVKGETLIVCQPVDCICSCESCTK